MLKPNDLYLKLHDAVFVEKKKHVMLIGYRRSGKDTSCYHILRETQEACLFISPTKRMTKIQKDGFRAQFPLNENISFLSLDEFLECRAHSYHGIVISDWGLPCYGTREFDEKLKKILHPDGFLLKTTTRYGEPHAWKDIKDDSCHKMIYSIYDDPSASREAINRIRDMVTEDVYFRDFACISTEVVR